MALHHASSGQVVALGTLDVQAAETRALLKARDLEIMWLVLPAGKQVPPHAVSTSMTLQCMRGKVEVQVGGSVKLLEADEVMYLAGGVTHGLHALEDARLLMTIVLPASRADVPNSPGDAK
ncbi:cupin 2 conserved barrel domain protein [Variovorax sp. Root411]|uniref:cupin 2 conserved barrel domain protein n=1 Tax=Variovorax sp. Root411 TaxID=1736530 RepID=UPI0006FCB006|nr:cupin 2 conserved barrel domain protein [Variovorax sp. Root411]KQW63995.1 cupin 2 conserved barrel domain protein [Variovorax sp. Root411]